MEGIASLEITRGNEHGSNKRATSRILELIEIFKREIRL
jgi:hypothetical protein